MTTPKYKLYMVYDRKYDKWVLWVITSTPWRAKVQWMCELCIDWFTDVWCKARKENLDKIDLSRERIIEESEWRNIWMYVRELP